MSITRTKKILIVDDEPKNLEVINNVFSESKLPYSVTNAPNGKVALELIKRKLPDLIITDWEMPEMNGVELILKLKEMLETKDIPVIMCTGIMISSENLETALLAGAVDYIRKPIDKIELIARTKANLHLAEKYNEIKKLNETKNQILSVISHDLRGPVGTIKTFTDVIASERRAFSYDELIKFNSEIGKQSGSVFNILENLLSWANTQRNKIVYEPTSQILLHAVVPNIELLEAAAKKKKINIINNIGESVKASFDVNLASTVVRNLIANAIKFTPENGSIIIAVDEGDEYHTIKVSDTGIGISPERIDKVFDKTSYETTYGTNKEKGSGLGLKLCLEFVEMQGGEMWVESELNKGSTFCFTLPV